MSIFVICGSPWSRTEALFQSLETQGVGRAIAAPGPRGLSIESLLSRLVPEAPQKGKDFLSTQPGKVYEQAAGDILIANWEQKHWGWADARNVWILDFLKSLDQNIRFILVHESPERAIARAILETDQDLDLESVVSSWFEHEKAMLRFHLRNAEQSLLIDAEDCFKSPNDFLGQFESLPRVHRNNTEKDCSSSPMISPLALLIARTQIQNHPEALAFNQEIESSLSWTIEDEAADEQTEESRAAENFRELIKSQSNLKTRITELKSRSQLVPANQSKEQDETLQRRLKEEAEENELLLAQLHQVQEELEHYFLEFQESKQSSKRHESRIQRLLQKDPGLYDLESLRLIEKSQTEGTQITQWELQGFAGAGRIIEKLQVSLVRESGAPALWIHRNESQDALIRWPSQAHQEGILKIQPEGPEATRLLRLTTIFAISPNDWELIERLCEVFSEELGKLVETGGSRLDRTEVVDHLAIVNDIGRKLGVFPGVFRFGKVQLKNLQLNPDYAHLWLELQDTQFGNQEWPRFEFRLSAAHIDSERLSIFPKLEFPLISDQPKQFSGWYEESLDDFGPKFELRFNRKKKDVNEDALNHLTPTDQNQLLHLTGALPEILSHLYLSGVNLGRDVSEWQSAATTILQILHQPRANPYSGK
jgi:hypothetical protein